VDWNVPELSDCTVSIFARKKRVRGKITAILAMRGPIVKSPSLFFVNPCSIHFGLHVILQLALLRPRVTKSIKQK
jgi:hypothetical protein